MSRKIFEPVVIGGLTLKNPLSFAPTSLGTREEERLEIYQRIAQSGLGLITVGDVGIAPSIGSRSIATDEGVARYAKVTEAIHKGGAKASAQLFASDYDAGKIGALMKQGLDHGAIKAVMDAGVSGFVTDMTPEQIGEIVAQFVQGARGAQAAGFDLIQIHGDRLLGSFSSAIYNKRKDDFGGSGEARSHLACQVVQAVRQAVSLPLEYKLAVRIEDPHYGNAGVLLDEVGVFVRNLEASGVDSFHVTLANHSKLMDTIPIQGHPYFQAEGCFLSLADEVKKYTTLPVTGVGKLSHPDFIEGILASGRVDGVAMSRQLIADPDWFQKVADNQEETIRYCCYCNKKCVGALMSHQPFGCILDPK